MPLGSLIVRHGRPFVLLGLVFSGVLAGCCTEVVSGTQFDSTGSSSTGTTTGSSSGGVSSTGSTTGIFDGGPNGTLWIGGSGALDAATLAGSGEVEFDQTCPFPGPSDGIEGPEAIDGLGDLWVEDPNDSMLYMWTPEQLAASCASGAPTLTTQLVNGDLPLDRLTALAFDGSGNLWASTNEPEILGFSASDLLADGTIRPTWILEGSGACLTQPCLTTGLAFDRNGYLWIGNDESVIAYSPGSLASLPQVPAIATRRADLYLTTGCYAQQADSGQGCEDFGYSFNYVAFDAQGDLWVSGSQNGFGFSSQIQEFTPAQLQALNGDSEPSPTLIITKGSGSNTVIWKSLAFDANGDLWTGASQANPNLWGISVAGTRPDINLTVPGDPSVSLAFSPIPAGLPIQP